MSNLQDFNALVKRIMSTPDLVSMQPVVEKEILHYDILFALKKQGLLENLVFQGGTSLRLCYGNKRFSEDLDFCGGHDFSSKDLKSIKDCLEDYLGVRYGLKVTVKEPGSLKKELPYKDIQVDKWQVTIQTSPERPDLPSQRIKFEVANVPAYTKDLKPININYPDMPDGYDDIFLYCESMNEIMADKLVSLPACTSYVRNRDIWDLVWLRQKGATVDADLISNKLNDYKLENYNELLKDLIKRLPVLVQSSGLRSEMKRFLPVPLYDSTFKQDGFDNYLEDSLSSIFRQLELLLQAPDKVQKPDFSMGM